jgi:gliding motility-associated-like protein
MVLSNSKTDNACYGGVAGAINLSVSNGWTPYTFTWSTGAVTEDISGLAAGNYTITVNDNHSCSATATIALSQPSFPININSTITDVTCNGGANGTISLVVSNGSSPYSYNWGAGITTQNRTSLVAGTYPVTVTDNSSCSVSATYTVTEPNAIIISSTTISPACNGANSGAINLTVTGGIAPYTYNWGGGVATQNRVNIPAGSYSVTVTDNTGCTATHAVSVTQPALLVVVPTVTNVSCQGGNTGAISLAVSGGTSPYTFSWGGGITTQNRTGLAANTYSVTVTDNAGCAVNNVSTVAQDASVTVTANVTNVSCFGGNNGAINISVSGGTTPYTYDWGSGITTQNRNGLPLGNYTVVVTDANGCTGSQYTAVLQPSQINISLQAGNVTCNGQANGTITTTVSGGTGSYNYNWGGGVITPNRSGLSAGNYSLTVTDANTCTADAWVAISEPSSIVLATSVVDVACYGASTGAVNLTASGGTGVYGYGWSNGVTSQNNPGLSAGLYRVTVTDANNCSQSASATVATGSQLIPALSVTNATCYGLANGAVSLSVSGGAGSYTYSWSNNATSQQINTLAAGSYAVTVTDAANCSVSSSAVVTAPAQLNIVTAQQNITCNGAGNGSINITVTGGMGAYSYNWSNGAGTEDISNLLAQSYTVTVTDNNLCTNTATVAITQPAVLAVTSSHTNVLCNGGSTGTITTTVTGGTSPYTFNWSDGGNTPNRTTLQAGSYSVTVSDVNGCSATASNVLTQPAAIILSTTKADVTCAGAATGNIDLTVSGGVSSYQYSWSNNAVSQDLASITAGNYTVTVSDANSCTVTAIATVSQPSPITISFALNNVTCYGGNNGSIITQTSGGNGGYVYNWSNGSQNASATNLTAGNYTLSINDATNCATSLTILVTQPNPIVLSQISTLVSCSNPNSGSIDLSVSGGAFPYTYAWSNAAATQDINNLPSGNYSVTVTDRDNCTATLGPVSISQPNGISLTTTVTNALCNGAANGAIDLSVSGGAGSYTYTWSNGAATQDINGLVAGNYRVTVTDANSCIATTAVQVSQAAGVQVTLTKTDATCFGSANGAVTTTINGNTGNVVYNWSNGATSSGIANVAAGTYTVTVRDAQNCSSTSTAVVAQPPAIVVNETHTNVDCNGNSTGAIQTNVSGGTGSYSYLWSNAATSSSVSNLAANTYRLTVTDAASCSASIAVVVSQPAILSVTETHKPYACANKPGAIDVEVSGGTGPYNYNWTNAANTQDLNNLQSGNYRVTVSDARGCVANAAVTISELPVLTTHILKTDVTCNGGNNGTINLTVAGGTAPYQYMWNNGATSNTLANLPASNYRVLVTDSNSCVITDTTTITQPVEIQIAETITNLLCHADANGAIQVSATGGNPGGYTYQWSNQSASQQLQNLPAGTYSVTVADNQSCSATETYTIQQPAPISITATIAAVACDGRADGQILVSTSGGQQPYAYSWTNSATAATITGLATGTYAVTVTDNNGCTNSGSYIVGTAPAIVVTPVIRNNACAEVSTGAINLTVEGGNSGFVYDWSNGSTAAGISNIGEGTYAVTVTDARNCSVSASYVVATGYSLTVDAMPSTTINLGESVQLTAVTNVDNGNLYNWTPASGNISCNSCATTTATPTMETTYTISVVDTNGCRATDTVTVSVNSITDIFIPNAFSPNNDGNNDVFQLFGDVSTISFLDMKIFNRWGELVFESSKHNFDWDGTYKGEIVPQGTYIYVAKIAFVNGYVRNDMKGSLTVIR